MELLVVSAVDSAFEPGTSSSGQRVQLVSADWPIAEATCHTCTVCRCARQSSPCVELGCVGVLQAAGALHANGSPVTHAGVRRAAHHEALRGHVRMQCSLRCSRRRSCPLQLRCSSLMPANWSRRCCFRMRSSRTTTHSLNRCGYFRPPPHPPLSASSVSATVLWSALGRHASSTPLHGVALHSRPRSGR